MFKTIILALLLASSAISTRTHPLSLNSPSPSPTSTLSSDTSPSHNIQVLKKRIPPQLEKALARFMTDLKAIERVANNFPDDHATLRDGLILQNKFSNLDEDLKIVTSRVKALGSLSDADSQEIISNTEMMEGAFESAMQVFITKKNALKSFPLGTGVFATDDNLIRIHDATMTKYDQFLFVFHNSTTCRIAVLKKEVHTIFQRAIDAYATA